MGALVCEYMAPALAFALKWPVADPNVEFIPSSLLSFVRFPCMHIVDCWRNFVWILDTKDPNETETEET